MMDTGTIARSGSQFQTKKYKIFDSLFSFLIRYSIPGRKFVM